MGPRERETSEATAPHETVEPGLGSEPVSDTPPADATQDDEDTRLAAVRELEGAVRQLEAAIRRPDAAETARLEAAERAEAEAEAEAAAARAEAEAEAAERAAAERARAANGADATDRPEADDDAPQRPRIAGPIEAFLRHPFITLLPILLLVSGAVALGLERKPEYTSKARISVGRTDVPAYALQNVTFANQTLAAGYSRAIETIPVTRDTADAVGTDVPTVRRNLEASPVPESTLIQVEAKGDSAAAAIELANAGSRALIRYIERVNKQNDESARLLREYRAANAVFRRLERELVALRRKNRDTTRQFTRKQVETDQAQLEASHLSDLYRAATAEPDQSSPLRLLGPAATADSDRREQLEQLIIIALAAGVVLGFALALLRTNWRVLKAIRA